MSKLCSEDTECPSYLELILDNKTVDHDQQIWQPARLILGSGAKVIGLDDQLQSCLLCRHPYDEVQKLHDLLNSFSLGSQQKVHFEPSEPSFELEIARTHHAGFTVHCWIDAGNATTGFYRWDAIGIRFFTTQDLLKSFLQQLSEEFLT